MGNSLATHPCFLVPSPSDRPVTLILRDGMKRRLSGGKLWVAGDIMFEFPECMVCHADSFFIGQRVPVLEVQDELARGHTYFVMDSSPCSVVTASMLVGLSPRPGPVRFSGPSPFRYVKGPDRRPLIQVAPEFIKQIIAGDVVEVEARVCSGGGGLICSTPELQRRYDQVVVRCRERVWSPKLETISEYKSRFHFVGMEWKH